MATLRRLFILACLLATLAQGSIAQPARADAPVGDSDFLAGKATATVRNSPINEDDTHFVADSGGDLDQYLFRTSRPDGKLKFNIQIKRYYFNVADANEGIRFDSSGF